jgi:hypothetical protein
MPVPQSPPEGYGRGTAAVTLHGHSAQLRGHWAVFEAMIAGLDEAQLRVLQELVEQALEAVE